MKNLFAKLFGKKNKQGVKNTELLLLWNKVSGKFTELNSEEKEYFKGAEDVARLIATMSDDKVGDAIAELNRALSFLNQRNVSSSTSFYFKAADVIFDAQRMLGDEDIGYEVNWLDAQKQRLENRLKILRAEVAKVGGKPTVAQEFEAKELYSHINALVGRLDITQKWANVVQKKSALVELAEQLAKYDRESAKQFKSVIATKGNSRLEDVSKVIADLQVLEEKINQKMAVFTNGIGSVAMEAPAAEESIFDRMNREDGITATQSAGAQASVAASADWDVNQLQAASLEISGAVQHCKERINSSRVKVMEIEKALCELLRQFEEAKGNPALRDSLHTQISSYNRKRKTLKNQIAMWEGQQSKLEYKKGLVDTAISTQEIKDFQKALQGFGLVSSAELAMGVRSSIEEFNKELEEEEVAFDVLNSVQIENGNMHEMPDFTSKEKDLTEIEELKKEFNI